MGCPMKHGARNSFQGIVKEIKKGSIMGEVVVEVGPDLTVTSVMTLDSIDALSLQIGDKVTAITKAINVVLLKDNM